MSLLAPIFLWLLPLTAIPLIIHLLNRRNLITIDFSTLRFLKLLERESIRKLQLLQLLLLILRTIIVICIIFMITRPVIKSIFNIQNTSESSLHAIILDDSFSIKGNEVHIKKTVDEILEQVPDNNQLLWINTISGLQYKGLREDIPIIDNLCKTTFQSGSITNALYILNENSKSEFTTRELYIITDAEHSSISSIHEYAEELKSYNIYIFLVPQEEDNLSITDVNVVNEMLLPNNHVLIDVVVENNGIEDKVNNLLQLIINEMIVGQQLISLQSGASNTFSFKTVLSEPGIHKGMVELDGDGKIEDNQFYFTLNIPAKNKIALISDSSVNTYYMKESLMALNKFGETLTVTEYLDLQDKNLKLFQQDVVIIFNPEKLNIITDSIIEDYLYTGGHVILIPNRNSDSNVFSYINNIAPYILENYKNLNIQTLTSDSFQEINLNAISLNDIQELFINNIGLDRNIRLFKFIPLPFHPEYTQIQLNDGSSIWNRYKIQTGILDVFGYALNLDWTNFPIKGSFLPFCHILLYSHNSDYDKLYISTGDTWKHTASDYYLNTVYHTQPDNSKEIIISDDNNTFSIESLKLPGYHHLETDSITFDLAAVNIASDELHSQFVDIETIRETLPKRIKVIKINDAMMIDIKQARMGIELWRYFLYGVILLLIIEMVLSNAKKER